MPAVTKVFNRVVRMLGAIPSLRWKSEKRVEPANKALRTISRLQRSPMISSARAAEQTSSG